MTLNELKSNGIKQIIACGFMEDGFRWESEKLALGCGWGLLFAILGASAAKAPQNPLKFSYLTVADGLSHIYVKEVKPDKLGFIWNASQYGLYSHFFQSIELFYLCIWLPIYAETKS